MNCLCNFLQFSIVLKARSSAEEYNGLEPQTREILDDSYIRNEGGESLHR